LSLESKTIRAFVAIQLPAPVQEALRQVQSELKTILPPRSAAWTRAENMHLTLRFLGGVEPANLSELCRRLRDSIAGFGALELRCERLGCFPDLRFPRVVWAWVHDEGERLAQLQQAVAKATGSFAETSAGEEFVGHITLAGPKRIKRSDAERLAGFVNEAVSREFGRWTCHGVELIRSELSPGGSRYTTLDVFPL